MLKLFTNMIFEGTALIYSHAHTMYFGLICKVTASLSNRLARYAESIYIKLALIATRKRENVP